MFQRRPISIGLLVISSVLIITVIGVSSYAKRRALPGGPTSVVNVSPDGGAPALQLDRLVPSSESESAPEFASGTWINSRPLTLKSLRGRVVLVEFWTFGCYNCRNTLPSVKKWDARYRDKGLTVVGVHSPETKGEMSVDAVRNAVASLGIRYPVVTDNDRETWNAYDVGAWPTIFVLDKSGRVRWMHVGEGAYDQTEQTIQKLLAEDK